MRRHKSQIYITQVAQLWRLVTFIFRVNIYGEWLYYNSVVDFIPKHIALMDLGVTYARHL